MASRYLGGLCVIVLGCVVACGGKETGQAREGNNGTGADGNGTGGTSSGSGGTLAAGGQLLVGNGGGSGAGTITGIEDKCDGTDNDGNGIVDDVDVGHDGVCDCLNIATIGRPGVWGTGDIFTGWLSSRSPIGAVPLRDQVITPELLKPFQIIVLLNVATFQIVWRGGTLDSEVSHAYSAEEAKALGDWVKAGGGLMTTIGYTPNESAEVVNFNALLADTGVLYSTTKLDTDGDITNWAQHPISDGMLKARIVKGVEPAGGVGDDIAWDPGDHLSFVAAQVSQGRVAMWGDEWITYDSEWANTADLQIERLWLNTFKWLSPPAICQVMIPPTIK